MSYKVISSLLIALTIISCQPDQPKEKVSPGESNCGIRVKVIYSFCSYVFVQILDEKHYGLGDAEWRLDNGDIYQHVFQVNNFCELGQSLTKEQLSGSEFEMTVVNSYKNECAVCMGAYGGKLPASKLAIRVCKTP